jgi:hypothetical protein
VGVSGVLLACVCVCVWSVGMCMCVCMWREQSVAWLEKKESDVPVFLSFFLSFFLPSFFPPPSRELLLACLLLGVSRDPSIPLLGTMWRRGGQEEQPTKDDERGGPMFR